MTYIKGLNYVARVNSEATANMSAVLKDFMIQSHERFYEITTDIMWLNVTVYGQSVLYMAVRI